MELFDIAGDRQPDQTSAREALAWRMRPRSLDEFVGQRHIAGPGKLLWRVIRSRLPFSLILWGPPGSGKTALARVAARELDAGFVPLNAVSAGVADLKKVKSEAEARRRRGGRTVLFLDEIHRFNRAQQDVLLPMVESGLVHLIGASTHNPFFAIIPPLASRSTLVRFEPLSPVDLESLLDRALADTERGLGSLRITLDPEARRHLLAFAQGDARRLLTSLEVASLGADPGGAARTVTLADAEEATGRRALGYDEDEHYDTVSAFIKSMRGTDPDAALLWMAKMIEGGEDPLFIARRIVICAAEDVGLADPRALLVAQAALEATERVGLPEARIILAEAAVYVACAPKSNAACAAIDKAIEEVRSGVPLEVPPHLRDTSYAGAGRLGHGKGYLYPHSYPGHWVEQAYRPTDTPYYLPSDEGEEKGVRERLERRRRRG